MSKDDKKGDEKADKKADKPEKKAEKPAKVKAEGVGGGEKKEKKKGGGDKPGKGPAEVVKARAAAPEPPRFRVRYAQEVAPALRKQFAYKNANEVPRLRKIVVNMGLGEAVSNPKIIETAVVELAQITGQKPVITRAKKAIANFKLREGLAIGAMVTLRKDRMWEFFDRLVNLALPRVRDFKGIPPKAFDGRGNYSLGMREHIVFPEIDYDKVEKIKGMNVSFVTTAKTDEEGRALLGAFGMPFRT